MDSKKEYCYICTDFGLADIFDFKMAAILTNMSYYADKIHKYQLKH